MERKLPIPEKPVIECSCVGARTKEFIIATLEAEANRMGEYLAHVKMDSPEYLRHRQTYYEARGLADRFKDIPDCGPPPRQPHPLDHLSEWGQPKEK